MCGRTYTLYLNSLAATAKVSGQTTQMGWLINWDNLFGKMNQVNTTCRVRIDFRQNELENTLTPADEGWFYNHRNGYLSANLPTSQQATSLGQTTQGAILGLISPDSNISWTADGTNANISNWCRLTGNTLNTKGIEISAPSGTQELVLSLYCYGITASATVQPFLMTEYSNPWHVLLHFDFEEMD